MWSDIALIEDTELVAIQNGSVTVEPRYDQKFSTNARPDVAQIVRNYLGEVEVSSMAGLGRRPDLNPIQTIGYIFGGRQEPIESAGSGRLVDSELERPGRKLNKVIKFMYGSTM